VEAEPVAEEFGGRLGAEAPCSFSTMIVSAFFTDLPMKIENGAATGRALHPNRHLLSRAFPELLPRVSQMRAERIEQ
jgi:hypothetical protein